MGRERLTACDASVMMARGALTSIELAEACLQRVADRDDAVRAWTYYDPELVRLQAQSLDAITRKSALHGIPVGIKDVLFTQDMPTSYNSPHYRTFHPRIDAAAVAVLRAAGAVIFGKNDTVEFAVNGRRARTRNPHDPARTPGGSSSGSAAAVADCQVPLSIGTQTGGSIIRPASYCGVWAMKPTWNAVPHEGFKVCSASQDTLGWYGRSADDIALLADVFALHDDAPFTLHRLAGLRIGLCRTPAWAEAQQATRDAFSRAEQCLRDKGAVVIDLDLPAAFELLTKAHKTIMQSEMRSSFLAEHRLFGDGLYPEMQAIIANAAGYSRADLVAALDLAAQCRVIFDALADDFDAILTPSAAGEAPVGLENTGAATFNRIWTLLHTPCVNVPGLRGQAGLPVGLTVTGPRFFDRKVLTVAALIGEALGAASKAERWAPPS